MKNSSKLFLSFTAALGLSAAAHASTQEGWQFELTPYIWATSIDADFTTGQQKAHIDQSFSDLIKNTDSAFMGMGVISYNRFVMYLDFNTVSLSDNASTRNGVVFPVGTTIKGEIDQKFGTGGIGYRFDTFGDHSTIDVLVGVRNTRLETTLKGPAQKLASEEDFTDPLLMLRPSLQISDKWRFNPTLSYGISGDSETTYELMPQFQYSFSDAFALRFGYKKLYYKVEEGKKNTPTYKEFDGSFSGPFIGIGWTFPTRAKPIVAAPPPAPMPTPIVAKCSDRDNDGVCDDADQCPSTPPGKRVGAVGCDCDYTMTTHFAFNSAELTDRDKAELDKLASVLGKPKLHFVAGNISGHTDSIGKPEYNAALSKRRADAVADYLRAKGVNLGEHFTTQGLGESQPVADNKSEAGRAENRRVVISRTDCGPAH